MFEEQFLSWWLHLFLQVSVFFMQFMVSWGSGNSSCMLILWEFSCCYCILLLTSLSIPKQLWNGWVQSKCSSLCSQTSHKCTIHGLHRPWKVLEKLPYHFLENEKFNRFSPWKVLEFSPAVFWILLRSPFVLEKPADVNHKSGKMFQVLIGWF